VISIVTRIFVPEVATMQDGTDLHIATDKFKMACVFPTSVYISVFFSFGRAFYQKRNTELKFLRCSTYKPQLLVSLSYLYNRVWRDTLSAFAWTFYWKFSHEDGSSVSAYGLCLRLRVLVIFYSVTRDKSRIIFQLRKTSFFHHYQRHNNAVCLRQVHDPTEANSPQSVT